MILQFTVLGNPVPASRPRLCGKRAFTPARTSNYMKLVSIAAKTIVAHSKWVIAKEDLFAISLYFYNEDRRRRDWDNLSKSVCDGMNKICYLDDSQIIEAHVYKKFDKLNPRVEIYLKKVTNAICDQTF